MKKLVVLALISMAGCASCEKQKAEAVKPTEPAIVETVPTEEAKPAEEAKIEEAKEEPKAEEAKVEEEKKEELPTKAKAKK